MLTGRIYYLEKKKIKAQHNKGYKSCRFAPRFIAKLAYHI